MLDFIKMTPPPPPPTQKKTNKQTNKANTKQKAYSSLPVEEQVMKAIK